MKKILLFTMMLFVFSNCGRFENKGENQINNDTIDVKTENKTVVSIDSAKVKELKSLFNEKTDKYDANKNVWVSPKSAPKYNNQKGNYLYFSLKDNKANNLRFRFQYYSDNWLFIEDLVFLIDNEPIKYYPKSRVERDNEGGYIWEWFDDSLDKTDLLLFEKISEAKSVEIKINGRKYFDERKLTEKDIKSFKQTLDYYKALNGEL